jgi:hypothetical protein
MHCAILKDLIEQNMCDRKMTSRRTARLFGVCLGARMTKKLGKGARMTKKLGKGARMTKKLGKGARMTKKLGKGARMTKKLGKGADCMENAPAPYAASFPRSLSHYDYFSAAAAAAAAAAAGSPALPPAPASRPPLSASPSRHPPRKQQPRGPCDAPFSSRYNRTHRVSDQGRGYGDDEEGEGNGHERGLTCQLGGQASRLGAHLPQAAHPS